MPMFGRSRRVARRTARRTSRRQMGMYGGGGGGLYDDLGLPRLRGGLYDDGYDEPARRAPTVERNDTEVDEIAKLARLHEQGVLTDEEFSAKKKDILGL
jgi:Short C-terminal domain